MHTGKQIVYHALQDPSQDVSPEAIAALHRGIKKAQEQLSSVKADEKRIRAALAALDARPRLSELQRGVQQLEAEKQAIQADLGSHQGGSEVQISAEDRSKLEQEWKQWQRHAAARRRICRDLWGQCTEVLPENTSAQELWVSRRCCLKSAKLTEDYIVRSLWGLKGRSNKRWSRYVGDLLVSSPLDLQRSLSGARSSWKSWC